MYHVCVHFLYICTYILCMYSSVCLCKYAGHVSMCIFVYVCTSVCMCVFIQDINVCAYVCVYLCLYVCVYVRM
jgi:hypothetical protein